MDNKQLKSLSQKPVGYLIAGLGGILGGPIGLLISPLVLLLLNLFVEDREDKKYNRFLIWALIGVIGAPLSISPFVGNKKSTLQSNNSVVLAQRDANEPDVPAGWKESGTKGIYWKWCSKDDKCDTSKVLPGNYYVLVKVWCKDTACGNIYGRINLQNSSGVVIGWTNDTAYGDTGQVVQLTFDTRQDHTSTQLTELKFYD